MSFEIDQLVSRNNDEIKKMKLGYVQKKKVLEVRFDSHKRRLHAILKLAEYDLEHAQFKIMNRKSRPEDIYKIKSM